MLLLEVASAQRWYAGVPIQSFKCMDTRGLFEGQRCRRFVDLESVAMRKLAMFSRAGGPEDPRIPSNHWREALHDWVARLAALAPPPRAHLVRGHRGPAPSASVRAPRAPDGRRSGRPTGTRPAGRVQRGRDVSARSFEGSRPYSTTNSGLTWARQLLSGARSGLARKPVAIRIEQSVAGMPAGGKNDPCPRPGKV